AEAVAGIEDSGFHDNERAGDKPFRWTNGNAHLAVPLRRAEAPQSLQVSLLAPRLPGTPGVRIKILLNKRTLFDDIVPSGSWDRTFDLAGYDAGSTVKLEI